MDPLPVKGLNLGMVQILSVVDHNKDLEFGRDIVVDTKSCVGIVCMKAVANYVR